MTCTKKGRSPGAGVLVMRVSSSCPPPQVPAPVERDEASLPRAVRLVLGVRTEDLPYGLGRTGPEARPHRVAVHDRALHHHVGAHRHEHLVALEAGHGPPLL